MIDLYAYEERIAIRQFCGNMSEERAILITDAERKSISGLAQRIAALAAHQREHAKPVPLAAPAHEPILDRKTMAAGDVA